MREKSDSLFFLPQLERVEVRGTYCSGEYGVGTSSWFFTLATSIPFLWDSAATFYHSGSARKFFHASMRWLASLKASRYVSSLLAGPTSVVQ